VGEIILYHRFRLYALSLTPLLSVDRAHPVLERLDELSPVFDESSTLHRPSRATGPSRRVSGAAARDRWAHLDSRLVFVIDENAAAVLGATAFLAKPFDNEELKRVLEHVCA
jgi:hypothetical protein